MIANGIILWSGAIVDIPAGYVLCDGNNGTPDLRDKFIVGAKEDDGGIAKSNVTGALLQEGGANSHVHTTSGPFSPEGAGTCAPIIDSASNIPVFYALAYIMKT